MSVTLRDARLPDDVPAMTRFVDALQHYEHAFEKNRRIDAMAGADYLPYLLQQVREREGRIFIAEQEGVARGWAVFHLDEELNYVIPEERTFGYVAELYVDEALRGQGVGRRLLDACEAEARARQLAVLKIGVVAGNVRAAKVYRAAGFVPNTLQLRKYL